MSRIRLFPLVIAALLAWGCAHSQTAEDEAMLIKASALTKVAAALESAVRFKNAPENLSEAELLEFSTRHDPGLLDPFRELRLLVRRSGALSSVLLCTQDGSQALIEARFDPVSEAVLRSSLAVFVQRHCGQPRRGPDGQKLIPQFVLLLEVAHFNLSSIGSQRLSFTMTKRQHPSDMFSHRPPISRSSSEDAHRSAPLYSTARMTPDFSALPRSRQRKSG